MKATSPPSGRTIVLELLQEMEERLYPLLYRTLAPSVYHVYLHPDDFREIEHVTSMIVADAKQGLTARVEEMNKRSAWSSLVGGKQPPIEIPAGGWEIHVQADVNAALQPRQLGIESRLSVPPPPRFAGGTPTTRIGRTVVTGTIRRSSAVEEAAAAAVATAGAAAVADGAAIAETITERRPSLPGQSDAIAAGSAARLSYVDDEGPHVFVMRKEIISIGRGGSAYWVDVQVVTGPRVSREHCRIRRGADGRFFLQDLSTWGTSIDGRRVPPPATPGDGSETPAPEHELPRRSRIQLADSIVMEFEA